MSFKEIVTGWSVEDYYNDFSVEYDDLAGKYHWNLQSWIPPEAYQPNKYILDAACGTGLLGNLIQPTEKGSLLHGFDLSNDMLEKAKAKNQYLTLFKHDLNNQLPQKVNNLVDDHEIAVPQKDFYDFAFAFGAFEYLSFHSLIKAINELFDRLKPDGRLVFNTHFGRHPFVNKIIPHNIQAVLEAIQPRCVIDRVDPVVAYTLPPVHKIWYFVWATTKKK